MQQRVRYMQVTYEELILKRRKPKHHHETPWLYRLICEKCGTGKLVRLSTKRAGYHAKCELCGHTKAIPVEAIEPVH